MQHTTALLLAPYTDRQYWYSLHRIIHDTQVDKYWKMADWMKSVMNIKQSCSCPWHESIWGGHS